MTEQIGVQYGLNRSVNSQMKYWMLSIMLVVVGALALPSVAAAQDHGEVGVFVDYFRLDRTTPDINFVGVGGRVAFNVRPTVGLEAEMARHD